MSYSVKNYNKTETAEARQSIDDKDGEYSYLYTECHNYWYSVNPNPKCRDGHLCPKCGKKVKVVIPK